MGEIELPFWGRQFKMIVISPIDNIFDILNNMNYHRVFIPNSYVFITFVTSKRRNILIDNIYLLRAAIKKSIDIYNYEIFAICVLPDHIHMIIKPYEIKDYPNIIKLIKTTFSKKIDKSKIKDYKLSASNISKKEFDILQRRYYEHSIISSEDLNKHTDYIHYNPIKHGHVKLVKDWKYSSFHKFVKNGFYENDWCNFDDVHKISQLNIE